MSTGKILKILTCAWIGISCRCILAAERYSFVTMCIEMFFNFQLSNLYSNACLNMGPCSKLLRYFYDSGGSLEQCFWSLGQNPNLANLDFQD